jgi:hypothetical protein
MALPPYLTTTVWPRKEAAALAIVRAVSAKASSCVVEARVGRDSLGATANAAASLAKVTRATKVKAKAARIVQKDRRNAQSGEYSNTTAQQLKILLHLRWIF